MLWHRHHWADPCKAGWTGKRRLLFLPFLGRSSKDLPGLNVYRIHLRILLESCIVLESKVLGLETICTAIVNSAIVNRPIW